MCKVLILLFIIITFIKNPENAPNLLALDHHLPLRPNLWSVIFLVMWSPKTLRFCDQASHLTIFSRKYIWKPSKWLISPNIKGIIRYSTLNTSREILKKKKKKKKISQKLVRQWLNYPWTFLELLVNTF